MTTRINGLKKSSPFLISLAVAVTLIITASVVFTEQNDNYDHNAYMVLGSGVSGSDYKYGESVDIPDTSDKYRLAYSLVEETDDYEVVGWDNGAEYVAPSGSLVIPATITVDGAEKNVTSLGASAFYRCTGLTSVTIPDSVTSIGASAFYQSTGITSVTIGKNVVSIGTSAFAGCIGLTHAPIPDSVTSIGASAFRECSKLTSITIPDSVTSIGAYAFRECAKVSSFDVDINNMDYSAEEGVLYNKDKTTLIQFPAGKTGSFEIPDSVTSIGASAIYKCSGLTSVIIPEGVTFIGSYAFYQCTGLTSVTIPASVTTIEDYAFYDCTGLSSFYVDANNMNYSAEDGVFYDRDKTTLIQCLRGKTGSFTIPDSVTYIENHAFYGCNKLTSIAIPDSVISIGERAFATCTGLTSVTIGNGVTSVGVNAFHGCNNIVNMDVASDNALSALPKTDKLEVLVLLDGITVILDDMFEGCTGLTSVTIGDSVTVIGDSSFSGCTGLAIVVIGEGVENILENAFFGCTSLSTIFFNGTPTTFEANSFNLGTESEPTTCTVYSLMNDGFLDSYKGEYTTFSYEPFGVYRLYINPNESSIDLTPDGWTKDGDLYYKDFTYHSEIVIPESSLLIEGYSFKWDRNVPSLMPAEDITLVAQWTINTYTITWKVDDVEFNTQTLDHGSTIAAPADDPVKEPGAKFGYEFMGWIGFTESMTASGDVTFVADFKVVLQMNESEIQSSVKDGIIEADVEDLEEIEISTEMFGKLLDAMIDDPSVKGVSISVSGGSISLNKAALEALLGSLTDSVSVTISEVNANELSQAILDKVGDRPVFSVNIGDVSSFGNGSLTVTLKYELGPEEDKNNLSVWFVNDEGTVEKYKCTYEDGYVTFVTDHLSYYAVMYFVDDGGAGGFPTLYAAVIAVVAAIALAAVFFIKKRGTQKE
ncbi:MAG: leucine-rich repeat domain-containing protein [Candidatus Methanomethylophilaceae archaeon]